MMTRTKVGLGAILVVCLSFPLFAQRTFMQTYQMVHDSVWEVLGLPTRTDLQTTFDALDNELDAPFRLSASVPADTLLNIGSNQVEKGDGSLQTTAPSDDVINVFPASTIDYQSGATTGGTIQVEGSAFALPACTVGQFRRHFLVYVSADNLINSKFSAEAATVGALENPGSVASALDGTPVGYLDLECSASGQYKTAASATNIVENKVGADSRIFRFGSGAGGGAGELQDFKIQSVSDPDAVVKKGFIILDDQREIAILADLTISLDDTPADGDCDAPADDTTCYLYVDMDNMPAATLSSTGRERHVLADQTSFFLSESTPSNVNGARYIPIGKVHTADSGNAWSGTGADFETLAIRRHAVGVAAVSPVVYETGVVNPATVGAVANDPGALADTDFPTPANVRYFHLDNDDGATILDDSSNATDNLTNNNSVAFSEKGWFGREGVATFDGSNYLSSTAAQYDPGDNAFTVGAWIKASSFDRTGLSSMGIWGVYDGGGISYGARIDAAGLSSFWRRNSPTAQDSFSVAVPSSFDGDWVFYVTSYDPNGGSAGVIKTYLNGQLADEGSLGGDGILNTGSGNFFLGGEATPGTFAGVRFDGSLQDFFFARDVLTDAQINAIYSKRFKNNQQLAGGHELRADSFPFSDLTDQVLFYNLDDVNDDSGNAKNLTAEGGVSAGNAEDIFGVASQAIALDGTDDSLSSSDAIFNSKTFSYGGWFALDDWTPGTFGRILSLNDTSDRATISVYDSGLEPNGRIAFTIDDGANNSIDVFSPGFTDGEWVHLAFSTSASVARAYINGEEVGSIQHDGLVNLASPLFRISGRGTTLSQPFAGRADEVFFTNRELSNEDIRKLASSRIDHNQNLSAGDQLWVVNGDREDGHLSQQLPFTGVVDKRANSVWLDLSGEEPGEDLNLQMLRTSSGGTIVDAKSLSIGPVAAAPSFPITHNLGCLPSVELQHEGAVQAGFYTELESGSYCDVSSTQIDCDLSTLTIGASNKIKLKAACSNPGIAVPAADALTDGLVDTQDQVWSGSKTINNVPQSEPLFSSFQSVGTVGAVANEQGALVDSLFPVVANVRYFHLDNDDGATILEDSSNATDNFTKLGAVEFTGLGFFDRQTTYLAPDTGTTCLQATSSFYDVRDDSADLAMGGWVALDSWNVTNSNYVFSISSGTGVDTLRVRVVNGNLSIFDDGGGPDVTLDVSTLEDRSWHHVVAVIRSNVIELYFDGQLAASDNYVTGGSGAVAREFFAGCEDDASFNATRGRLQDVFFYKGTLTASEINSIYSRRYTNNPQRAGGHKLSSESFLFSNFDKVAFYGMDTLNDSSGNSLTLTANNGVVAGSAVGILGESGQATTLDGVDDHLSIADGSGIPDFDATNAFTVAGWFRGNRWQEAIDETLFSRYSDAAGQRALLISKENFSPPSLRVLIYDDGTSAPVDLVGGNPSIVNFVDGSWHHIAATWDGKTVTLYADGEFYSELTAPATMFNSTEPFRIGIGGTTLQPFNGDVDEIVISNRAFSKEEIRKLVASRIEHNKGLNEIVGWDLHKITEIGRNVPTLFPGVIDSLSNSLYGYWGDMEPGDTFNLKTK